MISFLNFAHAQEIRSTNGEVVAGKNISASLVNPELNAKRKTATIQVSVTGVQLIDLASVNEKPMKGQGHIHYQVDNGMVIATPTKKLSFHELSSGSHIISATLAGNDHQALSAPIILSVIIP